MLCPIDHPIEKIYVIIDSFFFKGQRDCHPLTQRRKQSIGKF